MKAIEVYNLTKVFGNFRAVSQITLDVKKAEVFGLLGPNGAGKTTTIRMLCGLLRPTSGSGYVAGCDIIKDYEKIKKLIGYMSQKFSLYKDLTVEENIDFFCGIYRLKNSQKSKQKKWALEISGLSEIRSQIVGELPGGYKQRLALVCALLHSPEIVFLDEPTAGVDPVSRKQFWDIIYELKDLLKTTVLVTTHYMDEADHCERIALMQNGKLMALGTPDELKKMIKGKVYLIKALPYFQAREILEREPGLINIVPFGNSFHIFIDDQTEVEKINDDLRAKHIKVLRLEPIIPSLEDVFLYVVGK
ncbi:MAG: ABC transporter ATP-binding protein [bacterium]